ncbi:MAG: peptidoglycan-associated lipoprotein Pal [Syntrophales bacterium]|jgi:peptidoglycan-associated lipoprotein
MKRSNVYFLVLVVMGLVLMLFGAGCAKKQMVKEGPVMEKPAVAEQAPAQPSADAGKEKAMAEAAAKAKAEEAARAEQMAREKEEEARAAQVAREKAMAEEAAAKVEKEASQFDDIHFAYDKYDLDTEARAILNIVAKRLNAHPGYVMRIEGNCDERGSIEYNIALGQRRADAAMKYLVDLGVDKSRISTVSYGKERPLDPAHDEEAWAKNRRDHFVVTLKK